MASANVNDFDPIKSEATQAMDGVVDTKTSDTNSAPTFYGGTNIPADEMTLSIDHIREQLLSLMTPEALFNCRRLNRNWNSYATVELQERYEVRCTIQGETLQEGLDLLEKHQQIFPCLPLPIFRKYSFEKVTLDILSDPILQQFLRTYGYFIYQLSLIQNLRGYCYYRGMLPKEKDVMELVQSLLTHWAPNLSFLRLDRIELKVDWKESRPHLYQEPVFTLRTTDPEFEEIHSIPEMEKNENLKFFSCNPITGKMFELAIQLAPNLEEIQVRSPCADETDLRHFIKPLNRLRFCKDIQYSASSSNLLTEFVNLAVEGDLKLRSMSFMFGSEGSTISSSFNLQPHFVDTLYVMRDVDAINNFLACSWDSLETIKWRWMKPIPGLGWPEVMPNVSRIDLGPHHRLLEDGLLVFPPDFVWTATFPRLRELHFCEVIESSGFKQLLQCFKNQCIDTVEEVHVLAKNSEERERDATALANLEQLRELFPSAQVLFTYTNFGSDSDENLSP